MIGPNHAIDKERWQHNEQAGMEKGDCKMTLSVPKNGDPKKDVRTPDTIKVYFAPPLKIVGERETVSNQELCERIKKNLELPRKKVKSVGEIIEYLRKK